VRPACAAAAACHLCKGTSGSRADTEPSPTLRVDTSLVQVPMTVTDKFGRTVSDLEQKNFRVFDNKEAQSIVKFATDDEPVAVVFIFNVSGSVRRSRFDARLDGYLLSMQRGQYEQRYTGEEFQNPPQEPPAENYTL
jgi:hypothetical protein